MLLSEKQRIVKTTNSDFKDEENHDFNNCKSDDNMQLERMMKSNNFDNLDFDDESSSSNDENENENKSKNIDKNMILLLSSSNSSVNETASAFTLISTNLIVKNK